MFPNRLEALTYISDIRHFLFKENLTYEERKSALPTHLCSLAFDRLETGVMTAQFINELAHEELKMFTVSDIIKK